MATRKTQYEPISAGDQARQDELNAILHDKGKDATLLAKEPYRGSSESLSALARGLLFGVPAYYIGHLIGELGDFRKEKYHAEHQRHTGMKGKVLGAMAAVAAFFMAARRVTQEVKDGKRQVKRLQQEVTDLQEKNQELKDELKRQLRGQGVLDHYDEEWELGNVSPGRMAEKPTAQVDVKEADMQELASETRSPEFSG